MYSHFAYCCSEGESCGEVFWRCCWDLGVRNPQLIAWEVWSLHFQNKLYNSDNLLIVVFTWYCYWLFTYDVSICMKFDPAIHIAMYSILSLKPDVTRGHHHDSWAQQTLVSFAIMDIQLGSSPEASTTKPKINGRDLFGSCSSFFCMYCAGTGVFCAGLVVVLMGQGNHESLHC